jgi:hypothetical protein
MAEDREQRNEVFRGNAPPPGVDSRIPQVSSYDRVKSDFGLEVPVETVPLPSAGKVYPVGTSLHGVEVVDIKAMTAREEDILTSKAFLKKGTIITELIRSCLIDKSIDPRDLLSGDRNALMVAIRITGYGAEYDAEIECNECGSKTSRQFNLAELPIKRLDISPVVPGTNVFEFVLPYSKKSVKFKFLTGRDEEELSATAEKQKKLGLQSESSVTSNLLYTLVSIDGVEDRGKIANFVKMMPARDSLALRNYIRDNEPGIEMKQETSCSSCGHSEEVNMPLGVTFLWPSSGR